MGTRAEPSGLALTAQDAALIRGMIDRGDRHHDIAAFFGVNQGRISGRSGRHHQGLTAQGTLPGPEGGMARKPAALTAGFPKPEGRSPASRVLNTTNLAGPSPKINDPEASDGSSF